jgi:methyl-accepting chemotaxis protein
MPMAQARLPNGQISVQAGVAGGTVALIAGVILSLALSLIVARRIASRLDNTVEAARRIASGDLRGSLPPSSQDEVGKLIVAMGNMQTALREAMQDSRRNAEVLLESSRQLNRSVQQMEQSASLQSEAASTIAANTEQLTVSINHVANGTAEAASLSASSDQQAANGLSSLRSLAARSTISRKWLGPLPNGLPACKPNRPNFIHCGCHQGHCRPDQSTGAQCRHRGRTGWRAGAWLCRGGR